MRDFLVFWIFGYLSFLYWGFLVWGRYGIGGGWLGERREKLWEECWEIKGEEIVICSIGYERELIKIGIGEWINKKIDDWYMKYN
jgi:hypothetical protein